MMLSFRDFQIKRMLNYILSKGDILEEYDYSSNILCNNSGYSLLFQSVYGQICIGRGSKYDAYKATVHYIKKQERKFGKITTKGQCENHIGRYAI